MCTYRDPHMEGMDEKLLRHHPNNHFIFSMLSVFAIHPLCEHLPALSWKAKSTLIGQFAQAWSDTTHSVSASALLALLQFTAGLGARMRAATVYNLTEVQSWSTRLKAGSLNTGCVYFSVHTTSWVYWYFHGIYVHSTPAS